MATYTVSDVVPGEAEGTDNLTVTVCFFYADIEMCFPQPVGNIPQEEPARSDKLQGYSDDMEREATAYWDSLPEEERPGYVEPYTPHGEQ